MNYIYCEDLRFYVRACHWPNAISKFVVVKVVSTCARLIVRARAPRARFMTYWLLGSFYFNRNLKHARDVKFIIYLHCPGQTSMATKQVSIIACLVQQTKLWPLNIYLTALTKLKVQLMTPALSPQSGVVKWQSFSRALSINQGQL